MTPEAIWLAIAIATRAAVPAEPAPVAANERAVAQVSAHLLGWLADPSPAAAAALRQRVALGAPPAALLELLEGFRAAPRAELIDVVRQLAGYRRAEVRAAALAAWAELGGDAAAQAIAAAAIDLDPGIRRLAVALAARHPSDAADAAVATLLSRDAALAAELDDDGAIELVEGP